MTTAGEAQEALYAAIALQAKAFAGEAASDAKATAILRLAEALAWLKEPGQPH
jgi:hypothetical protein